MAPSFKNSLPTAATVEAGSAATIPFIRLLRIKSPRRKRTKGLIGTIVLYESARKKIKQYAVSSVSKYVTCQGIAVLAPTPDDTASGMMVRTDFHAASPHGPAFDLHPRLAPECWRSSAKPPPACAPRSPPPPSRHGPRPGCAG